MNSAELWETVLGEMQLLVSKPTFSTFFNQTRLEAFTNGVATIACNSGVAATLMEGRYYALIKNLLDKHSEQNTSLVFKVSSVKTQKLTPAGPLFSESLHALAQEIQTSAHPQLRADFTFESFAVSVSNQLAYAAATAVASSPGTSYNPLFFYGGVGVGKTHLMQAIGNDVLKRHPKTRVIYCMGEEFTNEIVDAIQTKTTKRFKDKYRSARILLIDDVQFLEGKMRVQEEFFHTFNAVQRVGGQIVLTSDRPPHEIDKLEERLSSRFEGGLLVDVQNPDFELKCAILRIKAQKQGVELPLPIAQILAANAESVRKLEGLLTRLLTESRFKKIPITEELVQAVVGKPLAESSAPKRPVNPKEVVGQITRRFGVTVGQLKGESRSRPLARPRQVLMYLLRTELRLSLDEVGAWVGGRDHSTVLHAVATISSLLSTNVPLRTEVELIKKELFS